MRVKIPVALVVSSIAIGCSIPLAYGAGDGDISPGQFQRYESEQELELEREQGVHAELNAPGSPEATRRQHRRFEAERLHQRQLLERQRRSLGAQRVRPRPMPRPGSSRGITLQRLQREQASERLGRKLSR